MHGCTLWEVYVEIWLVYYCGSYWGYRADPKPKRLHGNNKKLQLIYMPSRVDVLSRLIVLIYLIIVLSISHSVQVFQVALYHYVDRKSFILIMTWNQSQLGVLTSKGLGAKLKLRDTKPGHRWDLSNLDLGSLSPSDVLSIILCLYQPNPWGNCHASYMTMDRFYNMGYRFGNKSMCNFHYWYY